MTGSAPCVHRHRGGIDRMQLSPFGAVKSGVWTERVLSGRCVLCGKRYEVTSHRQTDLYPEPAVLQAMTSIIGEREVAAR